MNKLFPFEPYGTMPMQRGFIDDPVERKVKSGWHKLHSIPDYYPKQAQIYKSMSNYYNDLFEKRKPALVIHGDNSANFDIDQQLRYNAMQETVKATQYLNKNVGERDFTSEDVQQRIASLPNNDEIAKAIQVFENKLQSVMLSPEKKKEMRDAFYKDIFSASTEAIFKIAKDEKNKDIAEILNIVKNVNIQGDNADLGRPPPQLQPPQQNEDLGGAMAGEAFGPPPFKPPQDDFDEKELPEVPKFEVGNKFIVQPYISPKFTPYTSSFKETNHLSIEKTLRNLFIDTKHKKLKKPLTKEQLSNAIHLAIGYGKVGRPEDDVKSASIIISRKQKYKAYLNFVTRIVEYVTNEAKAIGQQLPPVPRGIKGDKFYVDGEEDEALTAELANEN